MKLKMLKTNSIDNETTTDKDKRQKERESVTNSRIKEDESIEESKKTIEREKKIKEELFKEYTDLQDKRRVLDRLYQSPSNFSHETINKLLSNDEEKNSNQ
jgi:hypothetical protein